MQLIGGVAVRHPTNLDVASAIAGDEHDDDVALVGRDRRLGAIEVLVPNQNLVVPPVRERALTRQPGLGEGGSGSGRPRFGSNRY